MLICECASPVPLEGLVSLQGVIGSILANLHVSKTVGPDATNEISMPTVPGVQRWPCIEFHY